jgi:hypothetical protein
MDMTGNDRDAAPMLSKLCMIRLKYRGDGSINLLRAG